MIGKTNEGLDWSYLKEHCLNLAVVEFEEKDALIRQSETNDVGSIYSVAKIKNGLLRTCLLIDSFYTDSAVFISDNVPLACNSENNRLFRRFVTFTASAI